MDDNAEDTDVRLWIGDGATSAEAETVTISGRVYEDGTTAAPYQAYIGANRVTDLTTFENRYTGFIFQVLIFNNLQATGSPNYGNTSCDSQCSICTTVVTDCMVDLDFAEYSVGNDCTSTSCDDISCVRDLAC